MSSQVNNSEIPQSGDAGKLKKRDRRKLEEGKAKTAMSEKGAIAEAAIEAESVVTSEYSSAEKSSVSMGELQPTIGEVSNSSGELSSGFAYDTEHPVLPIPVTVWFDEVSLKGEAISIAAVYVSAQQVNVNSWKGKRGLAQLRFDFDGFMVSFTVDVLVGDLTEAGTLQLQFIDPLGPHLPQLRNILNNYLSGDVTTVGSFLSYTGPTKPKTAKGAEATSMLLRIRGYGMALLSAVLLLSATYLLLVRASSYPEARPVVITRVGQEMRATTAGQLSYLNPAAQNGDIVFTINAASGDVLNFMLLCDCAVEVAEGIFEGATLLPEDTILIAYEADAAVQAKALISLEGLTLILSGANAFVDLSDGRTLEVEVQPTAATDSAVSRGDEFVPVSLTVVGSELGMTDNGQHGQLRIVKPMFNFFSTGWKG